MIYFYSDKVSPRLHYTLDFIFKKILQLEYKAITNEIEFNSVKGIKFNYSKTYREDCINVEPENILFEEDYKRINVSFVLDKEWKLILFSNRKEQDVPFDLFSSVFWLISRYEEYDNKYDAHRRFKFNESLLYKANVLNEPIVDIWIHKLRDLIEKKYNVAINRKSNLKFISTLDIDNLYAFKRKNFLRTSGTTIKHIIMKNYEFLHYYLTYYLRGKDIYDNYDKIIELHNTIGIVPVFFVLTINQKTKFDRNILCYDKYFIDKIKFISEKSEIAIHSSYYSIEKNTLQREKENLEKIIEKKVTKNRFHYLRFQIPESYRQLIKCGIEEDFSMGYSDITGFRAGTCSSFYFFDLNYNKQTSLLIHPFPFMDRFFIKNNFSEEKILHYAEDYLIKTTNYGGEFTLVWHNENLRKIRKVYYFEIYKKILKNASSLSSK